MIHLTRQRAAEALQHETQLLFCLCLLPQVDLRRSQCCEAPGERRPTTGGGILGSDAVCASF